MSYFFHVMLHRYLEKENVMPCANVDVSKMSAYYLSVNERRQFTGRNSFINHD